ncbi:ATP-binding protein [Pseudogemmobacter humi]|nr:ATP-binding protein [Pseudogemmobacter humi]
MDKRQAELELGLTSEGRGIAVIGESGSGKTTAIQRILRRLDAADAGAGELRWISIRVPTPATQKDLARAILHALDFQILRDTTASRMWDLVSFHLHLRKCWLIHLDEGQELGGRGSEIEKAAVINALNSRQRWLPGLRAESGGFPSRPPLSYIVWHDPHRTMAWSAITMNDVWED